MGNGMEHYPFRCVLSFQPLIHYLEKALSESGACASAKNELDQLLQEAPDLTRPIEDRKVLKRHGPHVQRLLDFVLPLTFWDSEAIACMVPLSMELVLVSPLFRQLFLDTEGAFKSRMNIEEEDFKRGRLIRAYLFILKKFYGIEQPFDYPMIHTVVDEQTGLDRHYNMKLDFRFLDVQAVNEPEPLSPEERARVLLHLTDPQILEEILPARNFSIEGFTIYQAVDVTASEVLSAVERDLVDQESISSEAGFLRLQHRLRTLFRRPELVAGIAAIQEDQVLLLNSGAPLLETCIFGNSRHVPISEFEGTLYQRASETGETIIVPDLLKEPSLRQKHGQERLLARGARSLLIAPLSFKGKSIGTLDLVSDTPGDFGPMDAFTMRQIQPLFAMAVKRALDDLEYRVQGVIKQECTAIHPCVEWRFRKAALRHLERLERGLPSDMESLVFNEVYPLYAVTDVRGSTVERNKAIQEDLVEHLNLALRVVTEGEKLNPLLILQEMASRIKGHCHRIESGLTTGDELWVDRFLKEEVEALFPLLRDFGPDAADAISAYQGAMDERLGTLYRMRRDFEESVHLLNDRLAAFLDKEEGEAQKRFPHYFERHRTDGVDYLIYMGAALLEDANFNRLYLKNMRLWQLKVACGMALHAQDLKSSLKTQLETAHLILVQDTPLSIRFRFDEKRFDADRAYDIRHEIIKSRIDKAVVKGGNERLTQPGKIAIVYSQLEEETEMRQHIKFLAEEGYLAGDPEKLELEELPGVQGLKALRVVVNLDMHLWD
jgi:hypothetical protein